MSDDPVIADYWQPGPALPDPTNASGPTRWAAPASDYATRPDGASTRAAGDEPAAVPPMVGGGPQHRPGWLLAGRPDKNP